MSYFLSGLVLFFVNGAFRFRASGHSCGVAGPLTLLVHFVGQKALVMVAILVAVFWSRLALGRHTLSELLAGSAIGIGSTLAVLLVL